MQHVLHKVQQIMEKDRFITVRVSDEMYIQLSRLASEMTGGNISKMLRKLFKRLIRHAGSE